MKKLMVISYVFLTNLALSSELWANPVSARLNQVIEANGRGTINVFDVSGSAPDLNAATIELFRQDNDGKLAFAVDVNEAANGTEKSSSQAVTLDTVRLVVVRASGTTQYTQFWTQTQTVVARKGSNIRSTYYSMIGDTGSSRITSNTASAINGSDFDATLYIPVNEDLSNALSITLNITLLDTQVQLGDPEAFYDFSNGYEDLAIVTQSDADLLDTIAAGQAEAPLVINPSVQDTSIAARVYYPSSTTFYLSAFEDRYPSLGDYDFNDSVVAYRLEYGLNKFGDVVALRGIGYLVARGALYDMDWGLHMNLGPINASMTFDLYPPGSTIPDASASRTETVGGTFDLNLFEHIEGLWPALSSSGFINTVSEETLQQGHRFVFNLAFDQSIDPNEIDAAPLQPILYVHDTAQQIRSGLDFVNAQGYPFGLILPQDWVPPLEQVDMGEAYPELVQYIRTNGNASQTWYQHPVSGRLSPVRQNFWMW